MYENALILKDGHFFEHAAIMCVSVWKKGTSSQ